MKITISSAGELLTRSRMAASAIEFGRSPTVLELQAAKVKGISLTARAYGTTMTLPVAGEVVEGGFAAMELKDIQRIAEAVGNKASVTLKTQMGAVIASGDGQEIRFPANPKAPVEPAAPEENKGLFLKGSMTGLPHALAQVTYAMEEPDGTRLTLQGVGLKLMASRHLAEIAAADGFRLAVAHCKAKGQMPDPEMTLCVPGKAALAVQHIFDNEGPITYWIKYEDVNQTEQEGGGTKRVYASVKLEQILPPTYGPMALTFTLTQGTYPNYLMLVPKKRDARKRLTFNVAAMQAGVKKVLKFCGRSRDATPMRIQAKKGELQLSARPDGEGGPVIQVMVPGSTTEPVAYGPVFFDDMISHATGDTATIHYQSQSSPGVLEAEGAVHVLMPMFVQWEDSKPKRVKRPELGPDPMAGTPPAPAPSDADAPAPDPAEEEVATG